LSAYVPEIVSAVIGLFAAWRVPTLRRRVTDHTKLLNELPPELQGPVKGLLREELAELVRRDRRRMTRLGDVGVAIQAGLGAFAMAYVAVALIELWAGRDPFPTTLSEQDIIVLGGVVSVAVVAAGAGYIARLGQRQDG
jgi:hypothetical protein